MICSSNLFCSVISLLVIALPAFADLSSITKNLQDFASAENVEILKAQACQDAPTLLSYTPSYKGVLKKRERKKPNEKRNQARPSEMIRGKRKAGAGRGQERPKKKGRSTAYWFGLEGEVEEPIFPGLNVPLQSVEQSFREMSRRNVIRPNIRDDHPVVRSGTPAAQARDKRQKTSEDIRATETAEPQGSNKDSVPVQSTTSSSAMVMNREDTAMEAIVHQRFSPSYANEKGKLVSLEDSMKAEPRITLTFLQGLALPKDMEQVPEEMNPNLVEMCSHLVQVPLCLIDSVL